MKGMHWFVFTLGSIDFVKVAEYFTWECIPVPWHIPNNSRRSSFVLQKKIDEINCWRLHGTSCFFYYSDKLSDGSFFDIVDLRIST